MTSRRWAGGGAVIIGGIAGMVWLMASDVPADRGGGTVRIAAGGHSASVLAVPTLPKSVPMRFATVASEDNVKRAEDQSYAVAYEKRDPDWAAQSEAALKQSLSRIAYIGGTRRLAVKCAASACEITGFVAPDPTTGFYEPVWQALERDTAGDRLPVAGLERSAAIFDTGRNPDEFRITFRRTPIEPL